MNQLSKKISRNIGIAKMRYYVPQNILKQLYYCLIYPNLTYGILVWGNAYENSIKNVVILQMKVIRIIHFSEYNSHTSELFKNLELEKTVFLIIINFSVYPASNAQLHVTFFPTINCIFM